MRNLERALAAAVLSACTLVAAAALPSGLSDRIDGLPTPLRLQIEQRATQLAAMAPQARAQLQSRQAQWDALPAAERARLREHWQAWTVLAPAQQQQVRNASVAFAALPPARQRDLRDAFGQLSTDARRGWLLGPEIGGYFWRCWRIAPRRRRATTCARASCRPRPATAPRGCSCGSNAEVPRYSQTTLATTVAATPNDSRTM